MTAESPNRKSLDRSTRSCSKATNKAVNSDAERKADVRPQRGKFLGADVRAADPPDNQKTERANPANALRSLFQIRLFLGG